MQILLRNRDAHPFLQGQVLWTGFRTKFIEYQRRNRKVGISRWTFGKKLTYLIDGVMSYSFFPIRVISVMGVIVALLGFSLRVRDFNSQVRVGRSDKRLGSCDDRYSPDGRFPDDYAWHHRRIRMANTGAGP